MKVSGIIILLVSLVASLVLYLTTEQPYGSYPKLLATISSTFIFYLIFDIIFNRGIKNIYILPYLILTWLFFQSPFLLNEKTEYFLRVIKLEYIDEIATYSFLSIILIIIGYTFFLNRSLRPLSSVTFNFDERMLRKLLGFFIIVGVLYRIGEKISPSLINQLSNIIQVLFFAPTIVFALYTIYLLRREKTFKIDLFHLIVITYLLAEFLLRLSTTLMAQVAILLVGGILAYYRERRKIPYLWLILALVIFIPLYQARKYFRDSIRDENISGSELAIGTEIIEKAFIEEQVKEEMIAYQTSRFNKEHNRFENLSFIAHVVYQHKTGNKPFLYGETFYWLPIVPIPRIIFPSKPENKMSTELATAYGVRGMVSNASINFPMLIEGYINFGFKGMLVMAFLFGLAYKWFVMKFGAGIGDINLLMVINSIKHFIHAEGNITLVFGALIQIYLFWWVILKVLKVREAIR
ncbi:MAG: hypothetical protein DWP98_06735 [Bacteroidetes bacterium]|nr:MAG: hypothetical protein DWP98_06735 [Bacteroidota bacterium]MBL1145617.1 hypothetical protein [Bacteroidota bacterium]NOG58413.1 hypothetical protein [Bacteroidota bacterium]